MIKATQIACALAFYSKFVGSLVECALQIDFKISFTYKSKIILFLTDFTASARKLHGACEIPFLC